MAKNKTEYDILISCPGDVIGEIDSIEKIIARFNDTYSDILLIRLNGKHWSKNSYNQSGGSAQDLLNNQFVNDCDAAIAIFWTKFGTPTDKYGSGTEEEIEEMLASGKQVFMYFCEKDIPHSLLSDESAMSEYKKIQKFKQKYEIEKKGIYSTYSTTKEFEDKLFAHLSLHFLSLKRMEEISQVKKANLIIQGIKDKKISDDIVCENFSCDWQKPFDVSKEEIVSCYKEIEAISLEKGTANGEIGLNMGILNNSFNIHPKTELPKEYMFYIEKFAQKINLELSADFFYLGDLRTVLSAFVAGSTDLIGTEKEKEKYNLLCNLYKKIEYFLARKEFDNKFNNLLCIKLALGNIGTVYDEDIDIFLYFPKDIVIQPQDFPLISEYAKDTLQNNLSFDGLFEIPQTSSYGDYRTSIKTVSDYNPTLEYQTESYDKEYYNELKDIFQYAFFDEEKYTVVKLHMEYIKHNTTIAFPTGLFIKSKPGTLKYIIRSKYIEKEIEGNLTIL